MQKLDLKLPFRKNYFFRHWNASMWAASGKYTNAMDFANDMGDKDINMIEEKYIKNIAIVKIQKNLLNTRIITTSGVKL